MTEENEELFTEEVVAELLRQKAQEIYLPDGFWEMSPVLQHIRRAAFARLRSPDAVLAALTTRYAVLLPPSIVLPGDIGSIGSLNMIVGIVSHSGGRKSSTVGVARDLLPIDEMRALTDLPLGSGEGIAEAYFEMEKNPEKGRKARKVRARDAVHFYVDEGSIIVSLGQRNGSTTSSTIRTAWSGGTLGQTNASLEAKRIVTAHTYRLGLVAAFQYSNAAALLAEVEVGTPQRFLWATATHPDIGAEEFEWPGELIVPAVFEVTGKLREVEFAPEVMAEIRQHEILEASGRVNPEALDTHRRMMKMKMSTFLAQITTGRLNVSTEIWEAAEIWLTCSDRIRDMIQAVYEGTQLDEARRRIDRTVSEQMAVRKASLKFDQSVEEERLQVCSRKIAARVWSGGATTRTTLFRDMRKYRDIFDEALDHAKAEGWVIEMPGGGQGTPSRVLKKGPRNPY